MRHQVQTPDTVEPALASQGVQQVGIEPRRRRLPLGRAGLEQQASQQLDTRAQRAGAERQNLRVNRVAAQHERDGLLVAHDKLHQRIGRRQAGLHRGGAWDVGDQRARPRLVRWSAR